MITVGQIMENQRFSASKHQSLQSIGCSENSVIEHGSQELNALCQIQSLSHSIIQQTSSAISTINDVTAYANRTALQGRNLPAPVI